MLDVARLIILIGFLTISRLQTRGVAAKTATLLCTALWPANVGLSACVSGLWTGCFCGVCRMIGELRFGEGYSPMIALGRSQFRLQQHYTTRHRYSPCVEAVPVGIPACPPSNFYVSRVNIARPRSFIMLSSTLCCRARRFQHRQSCPNSQPPQRKSSIISASLPIILHKRHMVHSFALLFLLWASLRRGLELVPHLPFSRRACSLYCHHRPLFQLHCTSAHLVLHTLGLHLPL
jgi:hypothetical protein